ncbi:hypothetical protein HK101_008122 [Irineochytrium annulatum]|nr:hypothetical protein HK101_008122 [Irineochytrium annulatum]
MASHLTQILQRLKAENLHGPTSPYSAADGNGRGGPAGARPRSGVEDENWILVQQDLQDLDAKDPRWLDLFIEYFLELDASTNDDLLFFVRQQDQAVVEVDQEPIFVRRNVGKTMPALNEMVDWKQTFFLNLIVQLPCVLTVAVCKRSSVNADTTKKRALLTKPSTERVVVVGGGGDGTELGVRGAENPKSTSSSSESIQDGQNTPGSPKPPRSKMVAMRRITKKVYAAPYKSRMDVKDAFMNECSYPLVYYTVNDYESYDLHLQIQEREYLCVELSAAIPIGSNAATATPPAEAIAAISLADDPSPFPVPPSCAKIILFQGAVPYSSLLEIFQQKGLAAQSQMRMSWGKLSGNGNGNASSGGRVRDGSGTTSPPTERTEYIMMRGPHGKGQCQVAIREYQPDAPADEVEQPPGSPTAKVQTLSDRLWKLGTTVRAAVAGPPTPTVPQTPLKKPDSLRCSMTYVNVPWQSIIR